jgi:hypothetical protein
VPALSQLLYCLLFFNILNALPVPPAGPDSRRSYHIQRTREHLLAAANEPEHPRNWRPQILAFSDNTERRGQLLKFASWIEGGSGLTTAVRILEGEGLKMLKLKEEAETELKQDIQRAAPVPLHWLLLPRISKSASKALCRPMASVH